VLCPSMLTAEGQSGLRMKVMASANT